MGVAGRQRLLFGAGAGVALIVTVIFATVGDGVDVREATGVRRGLIDYGHTGVWLLLAVALGLAAWQGRWTTWSSRVATVALVLYFAFLAALFLMS